jgi:hypothetical protein
MTKHLTTLFIATIIFITASIPLAAGSPPLDCDLTPASTTLITDLEGKDYVLVNATNTFKANLDNLNGMYKDVDFYTSEDGFIGTDNSGIYANAYKAATFNSRSSSEQVWAVTDNNPSVYCTYKNVVVHNPPTVSISSISGGNSVNVDVSAIVDSLSKNGSSGGTGAASLTYRFWNENANMLETLTTSSQSITFYPQYNGAIHVTVIASDGNYTASTTGVTYYSGGNYCTTCGPIQ